MSAASRHRCQVIGVMPLRGHRPATSAPAPRPRRYRSTTRPLISAGGTGPNQRLSTALTFRLSDSSHQPPSSRRTARLTRRKSGPAGMPGDDDLARAGSAAAGRPAGRARRSASHPGPARAPSTARPPQPATAASACMPPEWAEPSAGCTVRIAESMIGHERRRSMRLLARLLRAAPPCTRTVTCPAGSTTRLRPGSRPSPSAHRREVPGQRRPGVPGPRHPDQGRALGPRQAPPVGAVDRLLQAAALREVPAAATSCSTRRPSWRGPAGTKGSTDVAMADKLLGKIEEISKIFWETKQA